MIHFNTYKCDYGDANLSFIFIILDDNKPTSADPTNECYADTTHNERFYFFFYLAKCFFLGLRAVMFLLQLL